MDFVVPVMKCQVYVMRSISDGVPADYFYLCIYVFIYLFKIPPRDNRSDIHQSPQTQEGDQLPCPTSLFRLCWKGPDTLGCREEGKGKPLEGPYSLFPLRIVSLNLQKSRESSVVAAAGFFFNMLIKHK